MEAGILQMWNQAGIIENSAASDGGGVMGKRAANVTIGSAGVVWGNSAGGAGGGIALDGSEGACLNYCLVSGNVANGARNLGEISVSGGGILLVGSTWRLGGHASAFNNVGSVLGGGMVAASKSLIHQTGQSRVHNNTAGTLDGEAVAVVLSSEWVVLQNASVSGESAFGSLVHIQANSSAHWHGATQVLAHPQHSIMVADRSLPTRWCGRVVASRPL